MLSPAAAQVVLAAMPLTPPPAAEQEVEPIQGGEGAQAIEQGQKYGQGFGSPIDSEPFNDPPATYDHSHNIGVTNPIMLRVLWFVEAMFQITIDLEALPYPHIVSLLLGKYEIPETLVPLLDLLSLSLSLGLLEEISGISDPLMDLAYIGLLA